MDELQKVILGRLREKGPLTLQTLWAGRKRNDLSSVGTYFHALIALERDGLVKGERHSAEATLWKIREEKR